MSLFAELKRRNVFRVAIAYVVVTWLVLQVADVVLNNIEAPNWIFQVLMLLFAIGLPLVLVFAWVYEMTPEGLRRESQIDRTQSITPHTGRKLDRVISVVLALAVVYLLIDKLGYLGSESTLTQDIVTPAVVGSESTLTPNVASEPGTQSIAVLPFVNMSPDADNEYFSDGISEELLNVLVKVNALHVASRTSTFAYKDKDLPLTQIASELNVDHVLEGSVRKAGNRVRITAQLIDARNDRHLWSETYERELDDIFDIQEEISNAIVDALKIALNVDQAQALSRAQRPTDNTEAYEAYLQGRHLWRLRGEANIRAAIEQFRKAVEIDRKFAAAWESLAAATGSLSSWSKVTGEEALDEAIVYARKALELDPLRAEARAIVAEYHGMHREWAEMMREYDQVIADAPNNALLHQWRAEILDNLGYTQAALEEALTAYELDPAMPVVNNVLIYVGISAGREDLVMKHWKIATELGLEAAADRNIAPLLLARGEITRLIDIQGWKEDEVPLCVRAFADPALVPQLAAALQGIDDPLSAEQTAPIIGTINGLDQCYTLVGDDDGAIDMIQTAMQEFNWYAINIFWQPDEGSKRLRLHPRFKALMQEMGLVDYWREHGWPDRCRAAGADDFACD